MVAPIIELGQFTSDPSGGKYLPNLKSGNPVDGNLYAFSSYNLSAIGMNAASFTVTRQYANGPNFTNSAARAVAATGTNRTLYLANNTGARSYAAGTYTLAVQLKSLSGTQTVRIGDNNKGVGTYVPFTIDTSGWTKATITWTQGSSAPIIPVLYCASGDASADFLFDEVQLYVGSTTPSYTSEPPDGHMVADQRYGGNIVLANGFVDNTGDKKPGIVKLSTFPAKQTFTEGTLIAAVSTTQVNTDQAKALGISGANGTWDIAVRNGKAYGTPAHNLNDPDNGTYVAGHGTQILSVTFKSTEASFYLNGALIATKTGSFGPFSGNHFGFMQDPMPDNGNTSQFALYPILGLLGNARVYDQWLSDANMITAVNEVQASLISYTNAPVATHNYWIAEGDSLTTGYGTALDSYWDTYFASHPVKWMGVNMAVIGNTLTDLNGRLSTLLRRITTAVGCGHNVIVSVWVGANEVPTISALQSYWDSLRSAGAKVIACTLTPSNKVSLPTFETDRLALNTQIRAASSHYDALADLGANANIGVRSDSTPGNPPNATYFQDYVHLNAAGYTVVSSIIEPLLTSLSASVSLAGSAVAGSSGTGVVSYGGVMTPVARFTAKARARQYTGQA